ncbi:uncharacterized protein At4g26485 [Jatropha curcas]|uniref:uncharacterized protein At4g26485 n=1 Tax=Jatropha curcas TaxID=180498 RepID=UPI001893E27E|nr:uncharacterized protein At4g26485 [Jatropha curcas]
MKMASVSNVVSVKEEKWIKHYCSSQKILLVGEGDFSFAVCLGRAFGSATNIVATSLDSKDELKSKYSKAIVHLKELEELGCTIVHGVDALTMRQHPLLNNKSFDRIVFNFPHASLIWREHDWLQIELHKKVVEGFLKSARNMLSKNGEAHVTHKTAHPFSNWEIVKLAKQVGLCLVEEVRFNIWDYPGYENKKGYGLGLQCDLTFPVGACSTFKFA